jgi:hypothetical protein
MVTDIQSVCFFDLSSFEVNFNYIVHGDSWIGVSQASGIMGDQIWDLVLSHNPSLDLAQFEIGLLLLYFGQSESSLNIIEHSEEILGFWDTDNIYKGLEISWLENNDYPLIRLDTSYLF